MTGTSRFAQQTDLAFADPRFERVVGAMRAKIDRLTPAVHRDARELLHDSTSGTLTEADVRGGAEAPKVLLTVGEQRIQPPLDSKHTFTTAHTIPPGFGQR